MLDKECKNISRKLSRYLDNEVSASERLAIETHIKECVDCAAEQEELQKLTTIFRQIPDIIPAENSEELFCEKVRQAKKQKIIERIRSFITRWNFMPVYYPATALLVLGLVVGVGFSKIYDSISYQDRLNPSAVEYLALNRVDTIPYSSFAGVYLSGAHLKQDTKDGVK
jgi:anti-sigma factor RsiW